MTKTYNVIKFVYLFLFLGSNILAQNSDEIISMDEAIILHPRLEIPLSKDNRNIQVITKEEIQIMPVKSIQEILHYLSGVDSRQRGPMGSQADISMDGGSFEQTMLLLNGIKIIDNQTAHNVLNLPIPIETIERIEVVRGPAARIFGSNSLSGIINIVTQKPTQNILFIHTYAGTNFEKDTLLSNTIYANRGLQLGGTFTQKSHQHQVYLSHEKGNGYRFNTAFENNKFYYQGNFQLHNNHSLIASYGYVKNGFGANGFYASPGDRDSKEVVETTLISLQSKNILSNRLTLLPRFSYRYNYDDYRYYKYNLNKARSQHYSNSWAGEIGANYRFHKSQIGFGVEGRNDQINSSNIQNHTRNTLGFYAEYKTEFFDKLNINSGGYLTYNSQYGWQLFPGLDASYTLLSNLKILANIGTSQRIPSFTDLYLDQRPGNVGNPLLDAEKAFQYEIGVQYHKKNIRANAYFFHRKITNFIDWIRQSTNEPWQANNFGELVTNGFNTQILYKIPINSHQNLSINLKYAFLEATFNNIEEMYLSKYKIESLKHQFIQKMEYSWNFTSISIANRYYNRMSYSSYWVTDSRFQHQFKNNLSIYLDIQNLFNTTYVEVGSIPLPSRWLSLGMKYTYN